MGAGMRHEYRAMAAAHSDIGGAISAELAHLNREVATHTATDCTRSHSHYIAGYWAHCFVAVGLRHRCQELPSSHAGWKGDVFAPLAPWSSPDAVPCVNELRGFGCGIRPTMAREAEV